MNLFICFILATLSLCTGCESASSRSHLGSLLRIDGAQRIEGAPPQSASGPQVQGFTLLQSSIWPGQTDKPLSGTLPKEASAVSVFLEHDNAHYVVVAKAADVTAPQLPTFATQLSFSPWLPVGPQRLWLQAVHQHGTYGPPSVISLQSMDEPPVDAALVIRLRWQRAADLDLQVEQPNGQFIFARRKVSGASSAPLGRDGYLDVDSNAQCVIDGKQIEQVIYKQTPQPGRYRIRVDTFSLCEQATAYWQVQVIQAGQQLAEANGQSLPSDTRSDHGAQSGTLALDVVIP